MICDEVPLVNLDQPAPVLPSCTRRRRYTNRR
jgi:hypothetical protein